MTGDAPTERHPVVEPDVEKAPTVAPSAIGGVPAGADPADAPALADPVSAAGQPGVAEEPAASGLAGGGGGASIAGVDPAPAHQSLTDRPEVLVGAAFAGGLLLAIIFRRLGS